MVLAGPNLSQNSLGPTSLVHLIFFANSPFSLLFFQGSLELMLHTVMLVIVGADISWSRLSQYASGPESMSGYKR
jgi:hypothetical protein